MAVSCCPSLWATVCPDGGADRPAIHTTHCCRDRSDYLIRSDKNRIFMVINGPADGIRCLSSWTRGATFWWICLKLRRFPPPSNRPRLSRIQKYKTPGLSKWYPVMLPALTSKLGGEFRASARLSCRCSTVEGASNNTPTTDILESRISATGGQTSLQ